MNLLLVFSRDIDTVLLNLVSSVLLVIFVFIGESPGTRGAECRAEAPGPYGAPGLRLGRSQRSVPMCFASVWEFRDVVWN